MELCGFEVGLTKPLFLIAGPCVIESEALALSTAETLKAITEKVGIPFIYKSSFDKANRSSHESYRGPGITEGLRILDKVKTDLEVPVLTDVHEDTPLDEVADVVGHFSESAVGGRVGFDYRGPMDNQRRGDASLVAVMLEKP